MELKFIHITKCAGTSIEDAGKKQNILWGRFHTEYNINDPIETRAPWHKLFPLLDSSIINKYDWFTVVRNPYDRILSEYYCNHTGINSYKLKPTSYKVEHNKEQMNVYLIGKILNRSNKGGHFVEQYKYLHPTKKIHILKFENLNEELTKLTNTYNISNIELVKVNERSTDDDINLFTVGDFSDELILLINTVYAKDFSTFGYKMINRDAKILL